ncbi:acyl carrier protein [Nostoc sp.]|uniref:acyl carrier protein n=1 Tax=Nostoc sp. TaxID=1180 RepID=UPI002FF7E8C2
METLTEIFSDVLNISPLEITDQLSPNTLKTWNSMAHMKLVMAIEEAYDIVFTVDDVKSVKSFADARQILLQKGVES